MTDSLLSPINDAPLHRLPPSAPVPATGTEGQGSVHVLEPGQSPEDVARLHGVTEQTLRAENDLGPGQAVYPGTPLRIPLPAPGELGHAQAAVPADFDSAQSSDSTCTIRIPPDFDSMSDEQIKDFLDSPEYKEMAAYDRQTVEDLYASGRNELAASYLANRLASLPPEVATRFASECRPLLERLAVEAGGNNKSFASLGRCASALAGTPEGQKIVKETIAHMLAHMSALELKSCLQAISRGGTENIAFKLAVVNTLAQNSGPFFPVLLQMFSLSTITINLLKSAIEGLSNAREGTSKLDEEFAALLERVGHGLTPNQIQNLYREFIADPKHSATYRAAAYATQQITDIAALAPDSFAVLSKSSSGAEPIRNLLQSLGHGGRGDTMSTILETIKKDPAAASNLASIADMGELEQLAGASKLAETAAKTNDVYAALDALAEHTDGLKSWIGKIKKIIEAGSGKGADSYEADFLSALQHAGALANLIAGIFAMAKALTSPDPASFDTSINSMIDAGVTSHKVASDIVTILSATQKNDIALSRDLKVAEKALGVVGKGLAVVSGAKTVWSSVSYMIEQGEANAGDVVSIIGAVASVAGTLAPSAAAGPLTLVALILAAVGLALKSHYEEQKLIEQTVGYLVHSGMQRSLAERLARNPETLVELSKGGFNANQIQALATNYPWIFGDEGIQHGVSELARALSASGIDHARVIELFDSMPTDELQRFLQTVGMEQDAKAQISKATDRKGLINALEHIAQQRNLPEPVRETARQILEWASKN